MKLGNLVSFVLDDVFIYEFINGEASVVYKGSLRKAPLEILDRSVSGISPISKYAIGIWLL